MAENVKNVKKKFEKIMLKQICADVCKYIILSVLLVLRNYTHLYSYLIKLPRQMYAGESGFGKAQTCPA